MHESLASLRTQNEHLRASSTHSAQGSEGLTEKFEKLKIRFGQLAVENEFR